MSTLKNPDSSERPLYGTTTRRLPGGRIVIEYPDGRVVDAPADAAVTQWPSDQGGAKTGK
jgi:hypothetical protein